MARQFTPTGITINVGLGPCASRCRYCQLSNYSTFTSGAERAVALVDKIIAYTQQAGLKEFTVYHWTGNSFDIPIQDFANEIALHKRHGDRLRVLLLGGLPYREQEEMQVWFAERKAVGTELITGTFAGTYAIHDYWNNMRGNFDFQIDALRLAGKMGFELTLRCLLMQSTLPCLEKLLDIWDTLEGNILNRSAYPLFYSGLAKKLEEERITRSMLDALSKRARALLDDAQTWKTEREWVEAAHTEHADDHEKAGLTLNLTDSIIARLESLSAEEIIDDLAKRTKSAYALLPPRAELAEKYSDRHNDKLYSRMWDMETLWMDRYLRERPLSFERELTLFGH